jgi:putative thiamine transport system ATP-binding protein
MSDKSALNLKQIVIRLQDRILLSVDCVVAPGTVLTVMGPSGSGKSTLFNFIGGFLDPAFSVTGSVEIGGTDITTLPAEQRRIGLLFQDALLFPHMSVSGNLMFAVPASVRSSAERQAKVEAALSEAGLEGYGSRDPDTLSGGQKARIALMRTLLSEPRALLLDEPFSKLDTSLRQHMRDIVFSAARKRNLPMVLVTHDEADAAAAAGPVIHVGGENPSDE